MMRVADIRGRFKFLLENGITSENGTLEILNASFIADEEAIFGEVNKDYVFRELVWYTNQSLNINTMTPPVPQIWKNIASPEGEINSNYGWCIFSQDNGRQFERAIEALLADKHTRQAAMIYIRPSMHDDAKRNGMKDFMCTYSVQLVIRNNELHYMVYMRSNDAVFGYKNDRAWHEYVFNMVMLALSVEYPEVKRGKMYWNAASLHVYPRHFHLVDHERLRL